MGLFKDPERRLELFPGNPDHGDATVNWASWDGWQGPGLSTRP